LVSYSKEIRWQFAFAKAPVSGQAGFVIVKQNRDFMTIAGRIKKSACFEP